MKTVIFFQAEDGIRVTSVTGVQTCALPIFPLAEAQLNTLGDGREFYTDIRGVHSVPSGPAPRTPDGKQIGRASCRERVILPVANASPTIKINIISSNR